MVYDYKKEYARWKKWKDNEEKILRKHNIDETLINELRDFDWEQFNENRRFSRNQNVTKDVFFSIQPVYDKKEIRTIEDILNEIENESLYEYLSNEDPMILEIIKLKIFGYNIPEIAKMLNVSISSIYRRIKKVKKYLNK